MGEGGGGGRGEWGEGGSELQGHVFYSLCLKMFI